MVYTFAGVSLDTGARQLIRDGTPIHLTRKAFDLLQLLVQRRPAVISKEEIHRCLWPDTFVSESSVQSLISEIRRAVDQDRDGSEVRTVHGVGYAFSGEVVEIAERSLAVGVPRAWLLADAWRIALYDGVNVVGRGSDDVIVIDAPGISRRHARITVGAAAVIEDLDSKNGTWVRDVRVTSAVTLVDGDSVRLGSLLFTFRLSQGVDSTDTQASSRTAS